eukprot:3201684-Pyramimonas_sp.AAC.1
MRGDSDDLANCSVHQRRAAVGAVTLDQDECAGALVPIRHVDVVKTKVHSRTSSSPSSEQPPLRCSRSAALPPASSRCNGTS